jgi:hypothetical protein
MIRNDYHESYIFAIWVWLFWFIRSKFLDLLDLLDFITLWSKAS